MSLAVGCCSTRTTRIRTRDGGATASIARSRPALRSPSNRISSGGLPRRRPPRIRSCRTASRSPATSRRCAISSSAFARSLTQALAVQHRASTGRCITLNLDFKDSQPAAFRRDPGAARANTRRGSRPHHGRRSTEQSRAASPRSRARIDRLRSGAAEMPFTTLCPSGGTLPSVFGAVTDLRYAGAQADELPPLVEQPVERRRARGAERRRRVDRRRRRPFAPDGPRGA